MRKLHRVTTASIGIGLGALLLTGCGTAEAKPTAASQARVASVIPSGPSDLEREKEAEARAAFEAARVAAEAEAARVAAEQAAAEAARLAAEEAAREAARVAAEQAARNAASQSTRPGGTQTTPKPGGTAAPRPAPAPAPAPAAAPAPAPAPKPSNHYTKANYTGATLLSCNADGTMMTIRRNFTTGSYTNTVPDGVTTITIPSGERVNVMVECGM